jgi:hypothetical protein
LTGRPPFEYEGSLYGSQQLHVRKRITALRGTDPLPSKVNDHSPVMRRDLAFQSSTIACDDVTVMVTDL